VDRRAALWTVGAVVLVGVALVAVVFGGDEPGGAAGTLVAVVVIPLAIATVLRWLFMRRTSHNRVWSPWLLLITAAIGFFPALARVADDKTDEEQIAECSATTEIRPRFQSLPPGMAAEALGAEQQAELGELRDWADTYGTEFEARQLTDDGEPLGLVLVMTLTADDEDRSKTIQAMNEHAAEAGFGYGRELRLEGLERAREYTFEGDEPAVVVGAIDGCHTFLVLTPDGASARRIVSSMAAAPDR
jgi:hypothetical protein